MHLKIHEIVGEGSVVAACDAELIGKTLKGEHCDLVIDPSFYGDTVASEEEVLEALKSATNANIIGDKVCHLAIQAGIIDESICMEINGILHAQIYRL